MDLDNRLCRLGGCIRDAQDSIASAIREAEAIDCDVPEEAPDPHWPALSALIAALHVVKAAMEPLPGKEMADAIDAAEKELDYWSDRADGLSY